MICVLEVIEYFTAVKKKKGPGTITGFSQCDKRNCKKH